MFVIVFPQLLLVLYFDQANTYGSVFSYIVGLALRLLCTYLYYKMFSEIKSYMLNEMTYMKHFKICHIFGIQKPTWFLSFCHFVLLYFSP